MYFWNSNYHMSNPLCLKFSYFCQTRIAAFLSHSELGHQTTHVSLDEVEIHDINRFAFIVRNIGEVNKSMFDALLGVTGDELFRIT